MREIILPDPPGGGWWLGDIWCLLCWGDPINIFSWAGDTNEPPVTEGWWTGDDPLLLPPIEWRPPNFGDGTGDCGTWPMPSELLLLDLGSWIPDPAMELGPLLTVEEALLTEDAPLNWRRLFADVPRTTPDKVSISFLLGHGLEKFIFSWVNIPSFMGSTIMKYTLLLIINTVSNSYLYRFLLGVTGEPWLNCE